jgi:hypothetical protein
LDLLSLYPSDDSCVDAVCSGLGANTRLRTVRMCPFSSLSQFSNAAAVSLGQNKSITSLRLTSWDGSHFVDLCRALEAHSSLRTLCLQISRLDDLECATALCNLLRRNTILTGLKLQCSNLRRDPLGEMLAGDTDCINLTSLSLSVSAITFSTAAFWPAYLTSPNCKLRRLDLNSNNLHQIAAGIFESLAINISLERLTLINGHIPDDAFKPLLTSLKSNVTLTELDLRDNDYSKAMAADVIAAAASRPTDLGILIEMPTVKRMW